jgi:hypothetical protein
VTEARVDSDHLDPGPRETNLRLWADFEGLAQDQRRRSPHAQFASAANHTPYATAEPQPSGTASRTHDAPGQVMERSLTNPAATYVTTGIKPSAALTNHPATYTSARVSSPY